MPFFCGLVGFFSVWFVVGRGEGVRVVWWGKGKKEVDDGEGCVGGDDGWWAMKVRIRNVCYGYVLWWRFSIEEQDEGWLCIARLIAWSV